MRILFWQETFWPSMGGSEVLATKLLPALRERGHELIVVTRQEDPNLAKEDRYKGIPVYRFPFWTSLADGDVVGVMAVRQQVKALKRRFAPDLVHLNSLAPSALFHLETVGAYPAPLLVTLHGEVNLAAGLHSVAARALYAAAWVVGCSAATLDMGRHLAPEIVPRSSVIYNGLDVPPYSPAPLPTDAPKLLCLGRLSAEKGVDVALAAFASIVDCFPHVRLVIAGDGPARSALEQQAVDLGLTDVVAFVGWVNPATIPALMNKATVVVMPSRLEGFPLVALEAALMARPVVGARVGGMGEVILDQRTGLLVEPEDSAALAKAITFLLNEPEMARQMGRAARRRVRERFSLERCVNAYDALYQKLAKEVPPVGSADHSVED